MLLDRIKRFVGGRQGGSELPREPRFIIAGDSHASAFEQAVGFKEDARFNRFEVFRFAKAKGDISIGNIAFDDFLDCAQLLDERDHIFSVIGGNQYAVMSTVEHPLGLEFVSDREDEEAFSKQGMLIPYRTIYGYLYDALQSSLGAQLRSLRDRTAAQITHLVSPPPKGNNEFISKYFEKRFGQLGMGEYGPARPELRLKMWRLQLSALEQLCSELEIGLLLPPSHIFDDQGFLDPYYYAKDATHANRRYGREVLKQIIEMFGKTRQIDVPVAKKIAAGT